MGVIPRMSSLRYIFQGQQMQTVEYRNIHGPKKTSIVGCAEKMGQKIGPKFLDDARKKMGQNSRTRGKKWDNLATTSKRILMRQKRGTKGINFQ